MQQQFALLVLGGMLSQTCPVHFELSSIQMKQLVWQRDICMVNSLGVLEVKSHAYEYASGDLHMK